MKQRGSEITDRLAREIRKAGKREDRSIPAQLGDEDGNVWVGKGSRVYVTLLDSGDVIEVMNRRVPGVATRLVRIGIDNDYPNIVQVLGFQDVYDDDDGIGLPQDHHESHEEWGHDRVTIGGMQIKTLLLMPYDEFTVRLYGGWLATTTGFVYVPTQDLDLSASQPSAGALYTLIQVDDAGEATAKDGSEVDAKELLTGADIPAPDAGNYPVWAVALYDGQERVRYDKNINDFVDLRWGGYAVAGGAGFDLAAEIHAADTKVTIADADEFALADSASAFTLKNVTWEMLLNAVVAEADTLYQPLDDGLTSLSAFPTAANKIIYSTAADVWAESAITADALLLLADADVPRLSTANTWTAAQTINVNSTTALKVEQNGVRNNTLVVDTTNGSVGINVAASQYYALKVKTNLASTSGVDGIIFVNSSEAAYATLGVGYSTPFVYGSPSLVVGALSENLSNGAYLVSRTAAYATTARRGDIELQTGYYAGSSMYGDVVMYVGGAYPGGGNPAFRLAHTGTHTHTGITDVVQQIVKAFSTQTDALVQHQDSSAVVHNEFFVPYSTNVYTTHLNKQGSPYLDFKLSTDAYDAIFVDASNDSIVIMSNAAGKVGFFGATAVVQQAELTDELTTITFTAPTPDYAIQDLIDSSAGACFGFATKDEGNTVLSVVANLQARVNELESKLTAYGLLVDAD